MSTQSKDPSETVHQAEVVPPAAPPAPLNHAQSEVVRLEEQRINDIIERRKVILKLIASHIRPSDIRIFGPVKDDNGKLVGGNIHFERAACEQILMWSGVTLNNIRLKQDRLEDELGHYYDYEAWGVVKFQDGREVEVMGNCSTRSDFYGKAIENVKQGDGSFSKVESWKPLSEVDIPSVKQAAITNLFNHACVRPLGLKALTIEDLEKSGMSIDKIGSVAFGRGARGGATISPEDKQKQTELQNLLLEMSGGDTTLVSKKVAELSGFRGRDGKDVPGKTSVVLLTGNWLTQTLIKAKSAHEKYRKENGI